MVGTGPKGIYILKLVQKPLLSYLMFKNCPEIVVSAVEFTFVIKAYSAIGERQLNTKLISSCFYIT